MRKRRRPRVFLAVSIIALLTTAVAADSASASPEWHFNGTLLAYHAHETVQAEAASASWSFPGLKTTCAPVVLELKVENLLGGPGVGEVTGGTLSNCSTNAPSCTVETATAEGLPWPVHLTTIGSEHYLVVENVDFAFFYGGEECVLNETLLSAKGALGGLVNDTNHTVTFNSTTMSTVGAQLKIGSIPVEFNGVFSWFPTGGASSPLTVL
jgi:hypothetical protein